MLRAFALAQQLVQEGHTVVLTLEAPFRELRKALLSQFAPERTVYVALYELPPSKVGVAKGLETLPDLVGKDIPFERDDSDLKEVELG